MKKAKAEGGQQKETPRDILTRYMTDQGGMRKTGERYAILDVVMQMRGHHSADQILAMMPEKFPVSRATMYRGGFGHHSCEESCEDN